MEYSFEKGKFTESELEKANIELFQKQGYEYIHGDELNRTVDQVLLTEDLRSYLKRTYELASLTDRELEFAVNTISRIPSTPLSEGNKKAFKLINEGFDLQREDPSKVALHIQYIDFDNPENNIFKVINQYEVKGESNRIPDLLVFINGIPVAIWEFKTAIKEDTTVYDAWKQITIRYARDIPNLLKYCFMAVISDGANTRLGSIFTKYPYYYSWNKANEEEKVSNGISSLLTMIKGAFAKERILSILRDFIVYPDGQETTPIICRYPQFFAATRMLDNIKLHMRPEGDGKGGTYFGATGCGKTYTMLFLARLIMQRDPETFSNPTVILLEDREDLDTQTAELFITAKQFLGEEDVKSIESREDLIKTLKDKPSGGIYVMTIQKFSEEIGILSDRTNIICFSDEAHRTQTNLRVQPKQTKNGIEHRPGFAKIIRTSLPNATYCGFTGTPIDQTLAVFGPTVDTYTMKESCDDGITVRISYEPRLAKVLMSDREAQEINEYYHQCSDQGSSEQQVEASKRAMSKLKIILSNPDRMRKLALDMIGHYKKLCATKPNVVQKAMVVCADRQIAHNFVKLVLELQPEWSIPKKTEHEELLTKEQLNRLTPMPKINLVATRSKDDEKELYDACGTKEYRKSLERQFKNVNSNFSIAVVVDMWVTGFDVPPLTALYVDKPLQKHTLIQTISRVNRVYEGKEQGLVVDYIGIKDDMMKALKDYGDPTENPVDELNITLSIFRNHLSLLNELFHTFDASSYYVGEPLERLVCLNNAVEFIQKSKALETRFINLARKMKAAYEICVPSGELTEQEESQAEFYIAINSILYKQTRENAPDVETMNQHVEEMVNKAISCTGVDSIIEADDSIDVYGEEFQKQVAAVKMPITKFNALLKLLKRNISSYKKVNKVKAVEFDQRLQAVVDKYNTRDIVEFTSGVVDDFVNELSDQLMEIMKDLQTDQESFKGMGITFEEKAFYDILIKVKTTHKFEYPEDKTIDLAKKIKCLVDDKARFADWNTRDDIKNQLNMDLTILLYENGYPPDWDEEIFSQVLEQAENFKKNI